MDWQTIGLNFAIGLVGSLIGTGIGALIGYLITRNYAAQASRELRTETEKLRLLLNTALLSLESMGAKISRDDRGEPTGGVHFTEKFPLVRRVTNSDSPEPPAEESKPDADGVDRPEPEA